MGRPDQTDRALKGGAWDPWEPGFDDPKYVKRETRRRRRRQGRLRVDEGLRRSLKDDSHVPPARHLEGVP